MSQAIITCPLCDHKQSIEIPKNKCFPFYKCENCWKTISAKKESCCVICDYSNKKCPVNQ